jgi:hypothetical protein
MYMETKDYLVIKNIDVKTLSAGMTFFSMDYYDYEKRKEYGGNRGVHKIIRIPQRPNSLRSV